MINTYLQCSSINIIVFRTVYNNLFKTSQNTGIISIAIYGGGPGLVGYSGRVAQLHYFSPLMAGGVDMPNT